ncbi:hypothetical protein EN853_26245 [Mesorhizobium sp. M1C.F.Ca.ET.210.01.1.1]|uniref:hypothetical protein n=2 Tax=Mesorhizobium TaxID=68287 RepID=UPI000FD296B3|nr:MULTISPECIES: hypothetical protein [unclassified Mesorhizobium]TGS93975.1 hypothetical protein EN820_46915 [bacterium M00.F.Ca.ET.177.01.1.1]RWA69917.1 MAG: hypothetical protein EOQ28_22040 [Mesorhizobium sp.]RWB97152.1 MAG: hypothetical protein EOQ57_24870 [Mesorhizobium sp.]RWG79537.1 MAG: hypothetical protein EOQ70_28595 [Mesorhizobium sp.]RWG79743.1 MAG: hypothetical protein EOQ69_22995 [Mesorhizobium sp.]
MTITGKLCRNPFSTIKLTQEDGGSKAGGPAQPLSASFSRRDSSIFAILGRGFVDARAGAVYSESLGKSVIRVAGAKSVARP